MVKFVAFIKRRPDLTFDEFVEYYEANHKVIGERVLHNARHYMRRYIRPVWHSDIDESDAETYRLVKPAQATEGHAPAEYDVITEIWYDDRQTLDAEFATMAEPDTLAFIIADEEKFMDRSATRSYIVEQECESVLAGDVAVDN